MRVSVFGQRSITNEALLKEKFDEVLSGFEGNGFTYIYGGAKGPQDIIYNYVREDIDCILFQPWTMVSKKLNAQVMAEGKFDPVYFFFRNIQIVDNSDLVIVFDNGEQDAEVYKVLNLCNRKSVQLVKINV